MNWRGKLPDRRALLVLALLILLPVVAFSELFFAGKVLFHQDLVSIHYPLGILKTQLFRAGQLPLWNPYIQFGFPQLADQDILALNPLNLFYLLPVKPHLALSYFAVAHFVLAGIFGYVMGRGLEMSRVGALITAMVFALSGYLMAQLTNLPITTGSVWLPLIFYLFVKALKTQSLTYTALCAAAIGLQILAAHPQVVFYSLVTLGAYGAFWLLRLWRDEEAVPQERRTATIVLLSLMAIAVLGGLALAAVQVVPTLELKALSPRATGLNYVILTRYSLPPYNLLTFLFPKILGNPVIGYVGEETFEELHAYVGILPLLLVVWAWARRNGDGHVAFFSILAGVSVLLALGQHTPLYDLLVHVPGFNFFRAPARWLFIVTFALSILAGYGFDALAGVHDRGVSRYFAAFWRVLNWLFVALSLLLLAGLVFGGQTVERLGEQGSRYLSEQALQKASLLVRGLTRRPLVQADDTLRATLSSLNPAILFVLLGGAGLLVIFLWTRKKISLTALQVLVVGLIVVDLLLAGGTAINPVREASYYEREIGSTAFLQQNAGLYRFLPFVRNDDVENLLEDMPTAYGLYSVQGHVSQLALQRYEAFISTLADRPALLSLAGVKYMLVKEGSECPGCPRPYEGGGLAILENESAFPRAFIVHQAEVLSSGQAVLEWIQGDDFEPGRVVVLEEKPWLSLDQAAVGGTVFRRGLYLPFVAHGGPGGPSAPDPREARIAFYSAHRVVVETDLTTDGFLVLSDAYYPGWKVSVDGREDRIYQADYLFRAVPLRQGKHTVEFEYDPPSFRFGLAISLVAAAALAGMAVYNPLIRGRRRR